MSDMEFRLLIKSEKELLIPGIACFLIARSMPLSDDLQEDIVRDYIKKLHINFDCSPTCYAGAFILLDRFLNIRAVDRSNYSIRNIVGIYLISLVVAIKLLEDEHYTNAYYARMGGISLSAFNRAEVDFFAVLAFDLHMCVDECKATILRLLSHCCCLNSSHAHLQKTFNGWLEQSNTNTKCTKDEDHEANNLEVNLKLCSPRSPNMQHSLPMALTPGPTSTTCPIMTPTKSYESSFNSTSKSYESSLNSTTKSYESSLNSNSSRSVSSFACSSNSSSLASSPSSYFAHSTSNSVSSSMQSSPVLVHSTSNSVASSVQSSPVGVHKSVGDYAIHNALQKNNLSMQLKTHKFFNDL